MAKSTSITVPASTVRAFFQANVKAAKAVAAEKSVSTNSVLGADGNAKNIRGRINPAFIEAYTEATGNTYTEVPKGGVARVEPTVEIPRVSPKTGRAVKPTILPLTEARTLAGHAANRKGLLSSADKAKVADALTAEGR